VVVARPLKIVATSKRILFESLRTDSRVGLTFAALASQAAEGSTKRMRNQANARKAYDTVLGVSKQTRLNNAEADELTEGLNKLKSALEELGEVFP
jgi:hypothetical protein